MHTENTILIAAQPSTIYGLAVAVERWPEILPHYRFVRIHDIQGSRRLVEMAAWRDIVPVSWWAIQDRFPDRLRIAFRHVRGITSGMDVEWMLTPTPVGTRVTIHHDLRLPWPIAGRFVADRVVGPLFVTNIAAKTLECIKQLAESECDKLLPPRGDREFRPWEAQPR